MKRTMLICLAILLVLAACVIAAYPAFSNYINEKYASEIRTDYEKELEEIDAPSFQAFWDEARAYNDSLSPIQFEKESLQAADEEYRSVLDPSGSGIMGYIVIPKIKVNLPIYHGFDESILQEGIGHLTGSSLPIGGNSTHTVLTGHSGVAEKKLFSDLDQLQQGDVFYIKVLDATLAYEVKAMTVVLPEETDLLKISKDEDLCTLVTCTPFGVNTHRLLVRGTRIPYQEAEQIIVEQQTNTNEPAKSTWRDQYIFGLLLGAGIIGIALVAFVCIMIRRKKRQREEGQK